MSLPPWRTIQTMLTPKLSFPLLRTVQTMLVPKPADLSPEETANIAELESNMKVARERTYKFADVLFKSVSWLLLIGVVIGLWTATRYGVFLLFLIVMIFSFLSFALMRLLFPVTYVLAFFQRRRYHFGTWPTAIGASVFVIVPLITLVVVVPVAVRKATFALHCSPSNFDPARRPADCPVRPKRTALYLFGLHLRGNGEDHS